MQNLANTMIYLCGPRGHKLTTQSALPLKEPSVLTVKGLRRILLASDGVSARIFRMLNDVAIEAIETGVERITDEGWSVTSPWGKTRLLSND